MAKISVIMVVYNAEETVRNTIQSLLEQEYKEYEFIVIDGKSKDRTIEIVNEYKHLFTNIKVISEPDRGIYDAMNKGVKNSTGDYIYFLNSGDLFHNPYVLANVEEYLEDSCDILYGNVIYGNELIVYPDHLTKFYFLREKMVCHQSIFAKRRILLDTPFDCQYKYCADRHWLYNMLCAKKTIKHIDLIITNYDITGVSSNLNNLKIDSLKCVYSEFGYLGVAFVKIKRIIGSLVNSRKRAL